MPVIERESVCFFVPKRFNASNEIIESSVFPGEFLEVGSQTIRKVGFTEQEEQLFQDGGAFSVGDTVESLRF